MFTYQGTELRCSPIPVENWIELIKRERARTLAADEEQVAFGQPGLNGGKVYRLKQLRLEQLTDPCYLVAWPS